MGSLARLATAAATAGLLPACVGPSLAPEDRQRHCRAAVEERFGAAEFRPNPLSRADGALTGAAEAAGFGILGGNVLVALLLAPAGALKGTACAAGSLAHPTADADFERALRAADAGVLMRALAESLDAPRAECDDVRHAAPATAAPETFVGIDRIAVGMGCLFGRQTYTIDVEWRATRARTGEVLAQGGSTCGVTSFRGIDEWFAKPEQARDEIERALAATGRHVALQIVGAGANLPCMLETSPSDERRAK